MMAARAVESTREKSPQSNTLNIHSAEPVANSILSCDISLALEHS